MIDYDKIPELSADQIDMIDFYNRSVHRNKSYNIDPFYIRILKDFYDAKHLKRVETKKFADKDFVKEAVNQSFTTPLFSQDFDEYFEHINDAVEVISEVYPYYKDIEDKDGHYSKWKKVKDPFMYQMSKFH